MKAIMDIGNLESNEYLPKYLNTWDNLSQYTGKGRLRFKIDRSHLPAGTIVMISFQEKLGPDQQFLEFDTAILHVPVAVPQPPARGYLLFFSSIWSFGFDITFKYFLVNSLIESFFSYLTNFFLVILGLSAAEIFYDRKT